MRKSQSFTELVVWQKAHAFVLAAYAATGQFPREEQYGLVSQFRRAAVSIAANIAEGYRKRSAADKSRFFNMAEGSAEECRYYVILSADLGYPVDREGLLVQLDEVTRLLAAYAGAVRRSQAPNS